MVQRIVLLYYSYYYSTSVLYIGIDRTWTIEYEQKESKMVAQKGSMASRIKNYVVKMVVNGKVAELTVNNVDYRIVQAMTRLFPAYNSQYDEAVTLVHNFVQGMIDAKVIPANTKLDDVAFDLDIVKGQELPTDFLRKESTPVTLAQFKANNTFNELAGRTTRETKRGKARGSKGLNVGKLDFS